MSRSCPRLGRQGSHESLEVKSVIMFVLKATVVLVTPTFLCVLKPHPGLAPTAIIFLARLPSISIRSQLE